MWHHQRPYRRGPRLYRAGACSWWPALSQCPGCRFRAVGQQPLPRFQPPAVLETGLRVRLVITEVGILAVGYQRLHVTLSERFEQA